MNGGTKPRRTRGIGVCGAWQFGSGERPARVPGLGDTFIHRLVRWQRTTRGLTAPSG